MLTLVWLLYILQKLQKVYQELFQVVRVINSSLLATFDICWLFVGRNKCKLRPQIVRVLTLKTEIQSIAYLSQSQGLHDCAERQEDRRDNRAQTGHNRA